MKDIKSMDQDLKERYYLLHTNSAINDLTQALQYTEDQADRKDIDEAIFKIKTARLQVIRRRRKAMLDKAQAEGLDIIQSGKCDQPVRCYQCGSRTMQIDDSLPYQQPTVEVCVNCGYKFISEE